MTQNPTFMHIWSVMEYWADGISSVRQLNTGLSSFLLLETYTGQAPCSANIFQDETDELDTYFRNDLDSGVE